MSAERAARIVALIRKHPGIATSELSGKLRGEGLDGCSVEQVRDACTGLLDRDVVRCAQRKRGCSVVNLWYLKEGS